MDTHTGPRYVVQIGDKVIDYNEDFRLFMATRNPTPFIPPDAVSVVTEVNFTTTRAGLRGQVTHVTHAQTQTHTQSTTFVNLGSCSWHFFGAVLIKLGV